MKVAFVAGVSGQDGAYLSKLLLEKGYHVIGGLRRNSQYERYRLKALKIEHDIQYVEFELTEANNIVRIFRKWRFDEIYNLAAQSYVSFSNSQPLYTIDANAHGVARLLDAVHTYQPDARFYQASSSEMFGRAREVPQSEMTPFNPLSPYGTSKVFGHFITGNYRSALGLHATSGILFNHESPLRGTEFVTRKISLGMAAYVKGSTVPVQLGNLNALRDWGFSGDYMRGVWMMVQREEPTDYVLATGVSTSIRQFATYAADSVDVKLDWQGTGEDERAIDCSNGNVVFQVDKTLFRPAEVDTLLGDARKAKHELGWNPSVDVSSLAAMMVDWDLVQ